ncbi:hypothetical protein DICVIV_06615 [Dictyocaulus viviparus]|uniref:Uncharacterized protein n=1 Tax=Dictyocaulus viviparus TaxID=29172 RepID=A0A0D8XU86_DICVI|nr:hypothetical protein DICVIV_06615 [Dictyocaulus viviparus]
MKSSVKKASKALECAKWSAVEVAVIATQAGMTLEQIEEEYCKDSSSRKEVIIGDHEPQIKMVILRVIMRFRY